MPAKKGKFSIDTKKMWAKIDYYCDLYDIDRNEICIASRFTQNTYYLRRHNPLEFRLYEIIAICNKIGISLTELLSDC